MDLLVWFNFLISTKVKYFPVKTTFMYIYVHPPHETRFSFHLFQLSRCVGHTACLDVSTVDGKGDKGTSGGWFFTAKDGWDQQLSGDACLSAQANEEI